MALVDLSKIPDYTPIGSATASGRYHDDWGYFTFSQSVEFRYNPDGMFEPLGTMSITGVFIAPSGTDEEKFNHVKAKYESLLSTLRTASEQSPPSNLYDYGTVNDTRGVALPSPLVSEASGVVYARPVSFDIDETRWPALLRYTATFNEIKAPIGKITVDDIEIEDAVITITAEKPRLSNAGYAFANAEEVFHSGWDKKMYAVAGSIHEVPPSGALSTNTISTFINSIMDGIVTIGEKNGDTITSFYEDLFIDQSSVNIQQKPDGQGISVNISARL
jgi:hypothetical protein